MKSLKSIITITLFCILQTANAQQVKEHVELNIYSSGTTAEELRKQIEPLITQSELTIIEDNKATIYFHSNIMSVMKICLNANKNLPTELRINHIKTVLKAIPDTPKQTVIRIPELIVDSKSLAKYGLTTKYLLGAYNKDKPLANQKIELPSGLNIRLTDIGRIELSERLRPIIIPRK